jgi:site-specific recombinase XerD
MPVCEDSRNYAMLAVLTGCGLRRAEAAALKIEDLQLREGHWVIADLNGKGGHIRTIPMPDWVKMAIDQWTVPASILSGTLFRSINKAGHVWGTGFTPKVIWSIVKNAASIAVSRELHPMISGAMPNPGLCRVSLQ